MRLPRVVSGKERPPVNAGDGDTEEVGSIPVRNIPGRRKWHSNILPGEFHG